MEIIVLSHKEPLICQKVFWDGLLGTQVLFVIRNLPVTGILVLGVLIIVGVVT